MTGRENNGQTTTAVIRTIARELGVSESQVTATVNLLDEGNTVPFIARYRKELHGAMDDTVLRTLEERLTYLRGLAERRETVKATIEEQGKLTEELSAAIDRAKTLAEVEDLYRPYKQKRRTRATIAKEKGLEPLALLLYAQERNCPDPQEAAKAYLDAEKGVESVEDALAGASDIVAELISDDAEVRKVLRGFLLRHANLRSTAATTEDTVYRLYYDFTQAISRMQGHQILAVNRGEREGMLKVGLELDRDAALVTLRRQVVRPGSAANAFVRAAADDAWDRLLYPSLEREIRGQLTDRAAEGAIGQFALNLKPLLMQPPVKGRVTMGLDPGYRNGCKVAVVDGTGKVLDTAVVYPTFGERQKNEAIAKLSGMAVTHDVEHIAIGNGTASRETDALVADLMKQQPALKLQKVVVSEAGASVYSASEFAAKEFPELDVSLRGAVSIARRLQDPLAELVKIEPKAIGVGQYQHDVDQYRLAKALDARVEDCVNAVGVHVNTASAALLARVSGLSATVAENIVRFRDEHGPFASRKALLNVPRLGDKTFEQCAGFLRIADGEQPLDASAVHPEAYPVVERILAATGKPITALIGEGGFVRSLKPEQYTDERFGVPTVRDILKELEKPGRDPRPEFKAARFAEGVEDIKHLKPGMVLEGVVSNVAAFGAFVDIGVHQDGLVHISALADGYVKDPRDVVKAGDIVKVKVLEVDVARKRIALTRR
ncbi:MAG TPA: RNA-binding transcriptional accessory protein, partial [Corynebacterium variabile]|nr:RNA-binding transcriptional accessory protein [Corynebacterium variabile]